MLLAKKVREVRVRCRGRVVAVHAEEAGSRRPGGFRCRDYGRQRSESTAALDGVAFYRKYTAAMLRRYLRIAMEVGKVPACMPKEMFRGKVTAYRMRNFEDGVIFVRDMETCLRR